MCMWMSSAVEMATRSFIDLGFEDVNITCSQKSLFFEKRRRGLSSIVKTASARCSVGIPRQRVIPSFRNAIQTAELDRVCLY